MKLDINYENIEFEELIEKIFNSPPNEKSSIPISFDNTNLKEMHEALLMFFTKGMKKIYGHNGSVNLLSLNEDDFLYMNKYFESISINMNYKFYDINEYDLMYNNHFNSNNLNNLEDYCFKLKIEDKIFTLWFNII